MKWGISGSLLGPTAALGLRDQREKVLGTVPAFISPRPSRWGLALALMAFVLGLPVPRLSGCLSHGCDEFQCPVHLAWLPPPGLPHSTVPADVAQLLLLNLQCRPRRLRVPGPKCVSHRLLTESSPLYAFGLLNPKPSSSCRDAFAECGPLFQMAESFLDPTCCHPCISCLCSGASSNHCPLPSCSQQCCMDRPEDRTVGMSLETLLFFYGSFFSGSG